MFCVSLLTFERPTSAIRSARSLLASSLVDELLICDDHSGAENYKKLKEAIGTDKRVTFFRNSKNLGYQRNLRASINRLIEKKSPYLFVCESDMILTPNWAKMAIEVFQSDADIAAIAPMLHRDQLRKDRSLLFYFRTFFGKDPRYPKLNFHPFGNNFAPTMPNTIEPVKIKYGQIRFTQNSVGTIMFKGDILKKISSRLGHVTKHPGDEDAYLSYLIFHVNEFASKSLAVLDPGLAMTTYERGLHGQMYFNNVRWQGKWYTKSRLFTVYILTLRVLNELKLRFKNFFEGGNGKR